MKYTGRITGVSLILITIICVRTYAYIYFNYPLSMPPIPGVIFLLIAFKMGKKYDKVKFYSEKDSLTGLYNRRFIEEVFPIFLAQMVRKNQTLSIAILDCDNFKIINDTYGHKKGDLVLQEISTLLLTSIRKSDVVARLGGDEFLIIAPHADEEDIQVIVNQFKNKLQQLSQKLQIDICVSSGFAMYPRDAKKIDDLLEIADQKMYRVKMCQGMV